VQDTQTTLVKYDRLLDEFAEHMLDDTEGTIPAFRYGDELIEFMNENEVYEPTAARNLVHSIIEDLWDIRDEAERLAD
jgi:hypothetical protein